MESKSKLSTANETTNGYRNEEKLENDSRLSNATNLTALTKSECKNISEDAVYEICTILCRLNQRCRKMKADVLRKNVRTMLAEMYQERTQFSRTGFRDRKKLRNFRIGDNKLTQFQENMLSEKDSYEKQNKGLLMNCSLMKLYDRTNMSRTADTSINEDWKSRTDSNFAIEESSLNKIMESYQSVYRCSLKSSLKNEKEVNIDNDYTKEENKKNLLDSEFYFAEGNKKRPKTDIKQDRYNEQTESNFEKTKDEILLGCLNNSHSPKLENACNEKLQYQTEGKTKGQLHPSIAHITRGIHKKRIHDQVFEASKQPAERLADMGGIESVLSDVLDLIIYPLRYPQIFDHLGIQPPKGILLHGPPGCGKTKLALAIAGEAAATFYRVAGPELITGMSGESESMLRELFTAAKHAAPSIVFIDEIDAIIPKREGAHREMERRIVAQLGACMDDLSGSPVIVLGATNRPEAMDVMIRRNGRFDREIALGIPDLHARFKILQVASSKMKLSKNIDFLMLARMTPGFVGADLNAVLREAAVITVRKFLQNSLNSNENDIDEKVSKVEISWDELQQAVRLVQPSAKREGFSTIPDVTWQDVGALKSLRKELEDRICLPIKEAELYSQLGLDIPAGILLFGPPGCGKTLLAKAVANESSANFISIKGPELMNKYVGESERAVRLIFQRARTSAPCIIFFDELDSICPKRGGEGGQAVERVVNQLLTEMDGVEGRRSVFVIGATNRPDIIDSAMLRPGRLDRLLYVPLPDEKDRVEILSAVSRKTPLQEDVDFLQIAKLSDRYSGADLAALLREATLLALEERRQEDSIKHSTSSIKSSNLKTQKSVAVGMKHVLCSLTKVKSSVTCDQQNFYLDFLENLKKTKCTN